MRLRISHTTRYRFDAPVTFGLQQLRKTPKSGRQQEVLSWTTEVIGGMQELFFDDHHNNRVDLISFGGAEATELTVTCVGEVELRETHGVVGRHIGPAPLWLFRRTTPRTKPGSGVRALVRELDRAPDLDGLHALSALIREQVAYEVGTSDSGWSAEEALAAGRGVCQDHTHIFISCAREMGLPARYVSGYLRLDDREEQEAMHAWAEAHVEGLGWVGFDISNGISPDIRYIRVATGLDYAEAAPVTGLQRGGTGEAMSVEIEVAQQ